jgi:hypothetical protein
LDFYSRTTTPKLSVSSDFFNYILLTSEQGGAIDVEGNITPVAEFNTFADAVATARVFALTSPNPSSTMPPPPLKLSTLTPYPRNLSRPLKLTLFPLDVTTPHTLQRSHLSAKLDPLIKAGSPLAEWTSAFVHKTFEKIESLTRKQVDPGLELHDPLPIWYMLTRSAPSWMLAPKAPEDIRIETAGQWTRGMHVIDRRNRKKGGIFEQVKSPGAVDISNPMESLTIAKDDDEGHAPGDNGGVRNISPYSIFRPPIFYDRTMFYAPSFLPASTP